MSEILIPGFSLLAGILLGAVFFGGLWWTVLEGVSARQPALWFGVSLLLRTGITLAGFYFVAGASWQRLLACLLGFVIARLAVTRFARAPGSAAHSAEEAGHAP